MDERLDDYLALCQALGHIIVEWSLVERQIDNWVNVAFINCNGKILRKNGDMPTQFKQKREFLKDSFKLPALDSFKMEGLDLLHRASNLAEKRNNLIHGCIVDMAPHNRIFKFQVLKANKDHHLLKEFEFNPIDFPKLEKSLSDLVTDSIAYSQKLSDAFLK